MKNVPISFTDGKSGNKITIARIDFIVPCIICGRETDIVFCDIRILPGDEARCPDCLCKTGYGRYLDGFLDAEFRADAERSEPQVVRATLLPSVGDART